MLWGRQIKLLVEVIVEVFKLFYIEAIARMKEGYNISITK
jgi:hypothetical protein